jgi:hypothetical protein
MRKPKSDGVKLRKKNDIVSGFATIIDAMNGAIVRVKIGEMMITTVMTIIVIVAIVGVNGIDLRHYLRAR